jgi:hypothetical protein
LSFGEEPSMSTHPVPTIDPVDAWERAYKEAMTTTAASKAEWLLANLGPRITAAALGLADARQPRRWRDEYITPREEAVGTRLTVLFQIAYAISLVYGPATAALFVRSANPQLDDQAPLVVLRETDPEAAQALLAAATRSFLEG